MPEQIMIIVVVAIIAGTVSSIARAVLGVGKAAVQNKAAQGSSLTTGELKKMLQEVVEESNARMETRFDSLEARLDRLESAEPRPLAGGRIDPQLLEGDADADPLPAARRSRTT